MLISAVIPTLNESQTLPALVGRLREGGVEEIVVADGGSADGTPAVADRLGANFLSGPRGRGLQLNAGAAAARGDILFFVHADAVPPPGFEKIILEILAGQAVAAGAFCLKIADGRIPFRAIEWGANLRSRLFDLPYGDQGFFIRRNLFERIGGFENIPIMEDVEMVRRCRKQGRVVTARAAMTVSARRWRKEGCLMTTLRNWTLVTLYLAGVPAGRLACLYAPNAPAS